MKKNVLPIIVVLVILITVIWIGKQSWDILAKADNSVKAASITVFGSVVIFTLGRWAERSKDIRQKTNQEKIDVYKRFVDNYFNMMSHEKIHGKPMSQELILKDMLEFQKDLIFWGSDEVLRSYIDFKQKLSEFSSGECQNDPIDVRLSAVLSAVANVIAAMRKDIGYSFTTFGARQLASLQLSNDPETKKIFDHL